MYIAIISDIHSNLEALERTLELARERSVDEIICLGDIVGYGADPNACIDLVRDRTPYVLLGNHDQAAVDLSMTEHFNPYARLAAEWTHDEITPENAAYVSGLPLTLQRHGVLFVHSSPFEPEQWHYIISPADAKFNFEHFTEPICFLGHSHTPGVFSEDLWARDVVRGNRFIVNVGSVGQPRDGNWQLSFGVFDTEQWTYHNVRADYDVKTAAAKIRQAGLPKPLAERILIGR
jgi:predicted phosphodiesterase